MNITSILNELLIPICSIRGQLTAARKQRPDPPRLTPGQTERERGSSRKSRVPRPTRAPQCPRWARMAAFPRSPRKKVADLAWQSASGYFH